MSPDAKALLVLHVCNDISPKLAGLDPEIQGAILAELTALWLAGHRPDVRDEVLDLHQKLVAEMTTLNAKRMPWGK